MLTDVFLVELYFISLPALYSSTGTVELLLGLMTATSLWVLLQYLASGLQKMRRNRVHTLMFPPHPHHILNTLDFLIYFCILLNEELSESKERSGKHLKKQLILSFHLGTEMQVYLLGHSKACACCYLKTNGKTDFPE